MHPSIREAPRVSVKRIIQNVQSGGSPGPGLKIDVTLTQFSVSLPIYAA